MALLKRGSKGPEVVRLQQRLTELGFDPKGTDGTFGGDTEAAVNAFQAANGLEVDGQVGSDTRKALQLEDAEDAPASGGGPLPVESVTVDIVARMFPGARRSNIEKHLPIVLQALVDAGIADKNMVLMALGTIRAETAGFEPISEGISHFNTDPGKHAFNRYDNRGAGSLGNRGRPDGANFKGRGFVQLTGRANYAEHGAKIGLGNGLIENPELANDPQIAAKLLASFLKNKEQRIRNALAANDLGSARKAVNGGSHGLENFTDAFNKGKKLIA